MAKFVNTKNTGITCRTLLSGVIIIVLINLVGRFQAHDHYYNPKAFREAIKLENSELKDWDAPDNLKKTLSYYLGGYDGEGRPIWVIEFGKWDLRKMFDEGGDESVRLYEKYTDQLFYRMHNSAKLWPQNPMNVTTDEWVFFVDMEGYSRRQLSSHEVRSQTIRLARDLEISGQNLAEVFIVNANYIGRAIITFIKPVLGGVLPKLEVYGKNRNVWVPHVLKKIPRESLAEWYGGFGNFTPVAVYG